MNLKLPITLAAAIALAGCASLPPGFGGTNPASADLYAPTQAQQMQRVIVGTVVSVRHVEIAASGTAPLIGGVGGAVAGGLLGNQIGGGKGKTAATLIGALAGAVGGGLLGSHVGRQPGLEVLVKLSNGQLVSITQAADVVLTAGEAVQVLPGNGRIPARVVPLH
jgi:outer membrane lipoprotein SlyB